MTKTYTLDVKENDNGEAFIEFPDAILDSIGWQEGDTITWSDNKDGSWSLTKKVEDKVWVMVETVSQYRMRYMVQAPADHPEYALDTVVMEEAKEFSQLHVGETIMSHRVMTESDAVSMCDVDNDYCASWGSAKKIETFFTQ